jgi:hypothetical protein
MVIPPPSWQQPSCILPPILNGHVDAGLRLTINGLLSQKKWIVRSPGSTAHILLPPLSARQFNKERGTGTIHQSYREYRHMHAPNRNEPVPNDNNHCWRKAYQDNKEMTCHSHRRENFENHPADLHCTERYSLNNIDMKELIYRFTWTPIQKTSTRNPDGIPNVTCSNHWIFALIQLMKHAPGIDRFPENSEEATGLGIQPWYCWSNRKTGRGISWGSQIGGNW